MTKIRNSKLFWILVIGIWNLFRISCLGFRIFALLACVFYFWYFIFGINTYAVNGITSDPSRTLYSARQLGMGGVSIGFSNDANGVFSNPAGLTGLEFPQLTASSRNIMLDETRYSLAGWAVPTDFGTFGLGYVGASTGGSLPTIRDPSSGRIIRNSSLESSSYNSSVMALSYSRKLPFPGNFSLGGNLKFFSQVLSGGGASDKATGTNLDLAVLARPLSWLTVGASLQNLLGGPIKWSSTEDKLGGYYKIGCAVNLLGASKESLAANSQTLRGGIDLDLPSNVLASSNSMLYHVGLEYSPLNNIALRMGFNQEVAGSGLTLGVGLINGGFRFDYAYVQRPGLPGDNPHYFSLSYIGERVLTIDRKLKRKVPVVKIYYPKDRLITDQDIIAISAEAYVERILDQKRTWTVTAISTTSDAFEVSEPENLAKIFLNGKTLEKPGTVEALEPLKHGRNVIQLLAYTSPEAALPSVAGTAEVKILRITPFSDTPLSFWAADPIYLNVTLGLVKGYEDSTFKPDKGITRAELVTLLVRSVGVPQETLDIYETAEIFNDVKPKHWAAKYIAYGSNVKFVSGYPDGTFKPNKVLTRAEAITIFARYAGLSEEAVTTPPFPDLKPDFWANKFIAPAKAAGLLKYLAGKDFKPSEHFTRAEACEVLYQVPAIQKKVNEFWETGIISAGK